MTSNNYHLSWAGRVGCIDNEQESPAPFCELQNNL